MKKWFWGWKKCVNDNILMTSYNRKTCSVHLFESLNSIPIWKFTLRAIFFEHFFRREITNMLIYFNKRNLIVYKLVWAQKWFRSRRLPSFFFQLPSIWNCKLISSTNGSFSFQTYFSRNRKKIANLSTKEKKRMST